MCRLSRESAIVIIKHSAVRYCNGHALNNNPLRQSPAFVALVLRHAFCNHSLEKVTLTISVVLSISLPKSRKDV